MNSDNLISTLTVIVQITVIIVAPLVVTLVPALKKHFETLIGKNNYEHAVMAVKDIVLFIDQIYPELAGDKKYVIAAQAINDMFGDKFTNKEIEQLIESTVRQAKQLIETNKTA